ncbi:MAG: TIGR03960 family B12-binding radical SAM protein [Planctomycetota bacterium]
MVENLREIVERRVLPKVRMPGQYVGGEKHSIVKDPQSVQARVCLAFPDTYTLGMSHHGLQVLYSLVNADPRFACERAFCPFPDMEAELRAQGLPLYSLENFTPLAEFDMIGFSLQYEVCYTNILTILDLARIPLHAKDRSEDAPLVIAGGPGAQNPEPLAPYVDVFVIGDGEDTLLSLLERWSELKRSALPREERIARLVSGLDWAYAPRFYEPEYHQDGRIATIQRTRADVPKEVLAATVRDFEAIPIPTRPVIPYVECAHDRIAIEIMRGCPWQCRFCQSTVIKRPLRVRTVETIVRAAKEAYENTGYDEISVLSLSSSDYPYFEELVQRLHEEFSSKGVNISVPSLRINEQFRSLPKLINGVRKGGLTLAPEVARDDMRDQIRKPIDNEDLYEGCRQAFRQGWRRVKLYFMCGLPGERTVDLDGIVELAERISRIGKEETGRFIDVTASVSNFVAKPHTPYQWTGMRSREYFEWAHRYLRSRVQLRSVKVKCHDIDRSLLEGVLTRADRRIGPAILEAWRRGARLDAWDEYFQPEIWWNTFRDLGIDIESYSHRDRATDEVLPWDHVNVKKGREYLEKEHHRSLVQLEVMADAK